MSGSYSLCYGRPKIMSFLGPMSTILNTTWVVFPATLMSSGSVSRRTYCIGNGPLTTCAYSLILYRILSWFTNWGEIRSISAPPSTNARAWYFPHCAVIQSLSSGWLLCTAATSYSLAGRSLYGFRLRQFFLHCAACLRCCGVKLLRAPRRALSRFPSSAGTSRRPYPHLGLRHQLFGVPGATGVLVA